MTQLPVCQFCEETIINDGAHWGKVSTNVQEAWLDVESRRKCPRSPLMVKTHVPRKGH